MADINTQQIQDALDGLARTTNALGAAEAAVASEQAKNKEAIKNATAYFKQLGSTLLSSDRSLGKYSNSVSHAADAAASVASNFGIIGKAAGTLISIFGSLAAASLKQHDGLISTYRTLSNFGSLNFDSTVDGIEQLKDQLNQIGSTYENSAYFSKLIGDIAPDLISLSGDVGEGRKDIAGMVGTLLSTEERRLKNLGYTTESIAETAGKFTAIQSRLGINQGNQQDKLVASSSKYMTVLAELSALTGQSRDITLQQLEAQTRDVQWRAYLSKLGPEERKAAVDQIATIQALNPAWAEAAKEVKALNGGFRTQATAMTMTQIPELMQIMDANAKVAKEGGNATLDLYSRFGKAAPDIERRVGQFRDSVINMDAASAQQLQINYQLFDTLERLKNAKTPEEIQKFAEEMKKLAAQDKGRLAEQTRTEQLQRQRDIVLADLQFGTANKLIPALNKLSEIVNDTAYGMARLAKAIGNFIGFNIDWTESFRQFNSIKATQDALQEYGVKEKKLKEDQIKIQTDLNNALSKQQDLNKNGGTQSEKDNAATTISDIQSKLDAVTSQLSATESSRKNARAAQKNLAVQGGSNVNGAIVGSGAGIDESLGGLRKVRLSGDTHREGSQLDPRLIAAAQKLEQGLPELSMFTSFNDEFHKRERPGSKHIIGQAIDFTLQKDPTPEEFTEIAKKLRNFGFTGSIKDEYNKPDGGTRGKHIHAELATGGIISGPKTGYPAMLHGTEAVIPMNMFKDFGNLITKLPLLSGTGTGNNNNSMDSLISVMDSIATKIDEMVNYQRRSVNTQEEILTYTKH
jgi:hypothetical protein